MKSIIFLLLLTLLTGFIASAQGTQKVSGIIKDDQQKPLAGATVSLLKAKDSALVKLAVTDKTGLYELTSKEGHYLLSVTMVGLTTRYSNSFTVGASEVELPAIVMVASQKSMNAVTVTAQKPFIETKLDKTIVNVDASPSSAGSTALEVLEKSPGIMVNSDGAISLRGKQGVIVMVDGKPTYLSPADLTNLLKNMPASALETIEIMTNPSSRYDASGNSGIINIRTKKGKNDGFNGSFMLGATTSIYNLDGTLYFLPKSQNSFNFNYRKNKLNFFGNYNPNFFRGRNTMDINSKQIDPSDGLVKGFTDQQTRFQFGNFNQTLKLGVDWSIDKKNTLGVVASGFVFNGHPTPTTTANMYDVNHNLEARLISHIDNDISFKNFTGNVNYRHLYDSTGKELTIDFDYVRYSNLSEMMLVTDVYNSNLVYVNQTSLKGHLPSEINIWSIKSDYTKPLKNGRLEMGMKSSFVRNDNIVQYENRYGTGPWTEDKIRSNHFIYDENINAAYITFNRQLKKWTIQGGLRLENTISHGNQVTSKTTFNRDTTNLFPTAFVSYAANKKNTLALILWQTDHTTQLPGPESFYFLPGYTFLSPG
jgi:iron complex outermembrane receptor protein